MHINNMLFDQNTKYYDARSSIDVLRNQCAEHHFIGNSTFLLCPQFIAHTQQTHQIMGQHYKTMIHDDK